VSIGDQLVILEACTDRRPSDASKHASKLPESESDGSSIASQTPKGSGRMKLSRKKVVKVPSVSEDYTYGDSMEMSLEETKSIANKWIKYDDLEFIRPLNEGASGQVFQGFYKGVEVAIKVLDKQQQTESFDHEYKILRFDFI
jgi:hypothetical protein